MIKIKRLLGMFLISIFMLSITAPTAIAADANVSNETELQNAVDAAGSGDTVTLLNDITLTQRIAINSSDFTLDGNNFTLRPIFSKTDNSNNSSIVIYSDNVIVRDLIVDGSLGTDLHGIHIYVAENVLLDNITSNNNRSGVVVNGSTVTVNNITTDGNIWHGINVDQGGGVTEPSILTVNGTSSHGDLAHIYVDDTTKLVGVIDTNGQYSIQDDVLQTNDRIYTLIIPPGPYDVPEECSDIPNLGEPIIGTNDSDSIKGTDGNDLIFARGGSDSVKGGKGHDCIVGGNGDDSLKGQDGNDVILGGNGSDSIKGGNGKDSLYGGGGSDSLKGENGNDYIDGGTGPASDAIKGGKNTDTCINADSIKQCEL